MSCFLEVSYAFYHGGRLLTIISGQRYSHIMGLQDWFAFPTPQGYSPTWFTRCRSGEPFRYSDSCSCAYLFYVFRECSVLHLTKRARVSLQVEQIRQSRCIPSRHRCENGVTSVPVHEMHCIIIQETFYTDNSAVLTFFKASS